MVNGDARAVVRGRRTLAALVAAVGLLTAAASIRSPDAEVGFRTALALAQHGSFAVDQQLESWPGFGLPVGRDGRRYSVFGPLMPLLQAPVVRVFDAILPPDWQPIGLAVPPSHYFGDGLRAAMLRQPVAPESARGHVLRSLVSLTDIGLLILSALAAFELGLALTGVVWIAWLAGLLLTLGTFFLSYSTCGFSEPLAILCTLVALRLIVDSEAAPRALAGGGLALGLAAAAHISAVLALPFAAAVVIAVAPKPREGLLRAGWLALGAAVPLALLGVYNQVRFGSWLETGRGLQSGFGYGVFTSPWEGLYGLSVSFGKGLLWYCPLAVAAIAAAFLVRRNAPAVIAALAVLFRIGFIACRSDWSAGFCLGPRYLLLALPFALLPPLLWAGAHAETIVSTRRRRIALHAVVLAAVTQQLCFASGEIFTFEHRMKIRGNMMAALGGHPDLYFDWSLSPLRRLLSESSGPFVYRWLTSSTWLNALLLSMLVAPLVSLALRDVMRNRD